MKSKSNLYSKLHSLHVERIIGVAITIAWIMIIVIGIFSKSNIGALLASMLIAPLVVLSFIFGFAFIMTKLSILFS